MAALATSVVKIQDVLLVILPPDPDDPTISALQEQILQAMERHEARGLVLDLSTVEIVDSFFARMITETAQMVALMGGRTVIAGMRAPVAVTVIQLGLSLGESAAALTVNRALALLDSDLGHRATT